jgi:hypothetical protein
MIGCDKCERWYHEKCFKQSRQLKRMPSSRRCEDGICRRTIVCSVCHKAAKASAPPRSQQRGADHGGRPDDEQGGKGGGEGGDKGGSAMNLRSGACADGGVCMCVCAHAHTGIMLQIVRRCGRKGQRQQRCGRHAQWCIHV